MTPFFGLTLQKVAPKSDRFGPVCVATATRKNPVFHVNSAGQCEAPPPPRPGYATLTVGKESVTLDPLLPRDEFDRRASRWDELSKRAFGRL